jgi:phage tail-like protein
MRIFRRRRGYPAEPVDADCERGATRVALRSRDAQPRGRTQRRLNPMAPPIEPYRNFNFVVEIDGLAVAGFDEVSGLCSEVDVIEYREGDDGPVRKLPGLRKYGNIALKRGVGAARELHDWHADVLRGNTVRRNGAVILRDRAGTEVARWKFYDAFPCKWEGPVLNGSGNEIAIETFTLCCDAIERA